MAKYPKCDLPPYKPRNERECGNCERSGEVGTYFSVHANCWGYNCYCPVLKQNVEARLGGCDKFLKKGSVVYATTQSPEKKKQIYYSSVEEMRRASKGAE